MLALVVFLFGTEAIIYYMWLKNFGFYIDLMNTATVSYDALQFFKFCYEKVTLLDIMKYFFSPSYAPKLHHFFTTLFIVVFGKTYLSMAIVNTLYLLILMVSIYGITFQFTQNRMYGFLSTLMVSTYPGIIFFMRTCELQMGVISFVTLTVYLLILSKYFTKKIYVLLFAVFFSLSMYMDRVSPGVFIIGPLIYVGFSTFKKVRKREIGRESLVNLFLSIALVLILLVPFYKNWFLNQILDPLNFSQMISTGDYNMLNSFRDLSYFSPHKLLFYIYTLPQFHLGTLWFVMSLWAVFLYFKRNQINILTWWLLCPLIFFTIVPKKNYTYLFPVLSSLAVLSSIAISTLKNKFLRLFSFYLIVFLGIANFFIFICYPSFADKWILINNTRGREKGVTDPERPHIGSEMITVHKWLNYQSELLDFLGNSNIALIQENPWQKPFFDVELANFISLRNHSNSPIVSTVGSSWTIFYNSDFRGPDFIAFIKNPSSQSFLVASVTEWACERSQYLCKVISDGSKLNLFSYKLFHSKECPGFPLRIDIYKKFRNGK